MKSLCKITFLTFLVVILSFNVAAFGIVMDYTDERPLVMQPGEIKDINLRLQNAVGDDDISLEVTLTKGSEIAKITDKSLIYVVPKGSVDTKINMKITIPPDEKIGNEHQVGISIKEVSSQGKGMVQLTNSIDKSFNVIVGSKPSTPKAEVVEVPQPTEKSTGLTALIVVVAVLAAFVLAFYLYSKKQRKPKRKTKFK